MMYNSCYDTCNSMDNQRTIRSTTTIFSASLYNTGCGNVGERHKCILSLIVIMLRMRCVDCTIAESQMKYDVCWDVGRQSVTIHIQMYRVHILRHVTPYFTLGLDYIETLGNP
jgi:hypothetical protein